VRETHQSAASVVNTGAFHAPYGTSAFGWLGHSAAARRENIECFLDTKTRKDESSKEAKRVGEKYLFRGFDLSRFRGETRWEVGATAGLSSSE
jgi:hypothetical protein